MLVDKDRSKLKKPRRLFLKHIVRKIFLEDWAMKLVALVITLGLWFGVNFVNKGKPITQTFTAVPLNLRVLDNAVVTHAQVQDVEIGVRGVDDQVYKIRRNDLVVFVDLTDLALGDHVLTLTPESVSISLPPGVTLFDLQPSRIAVTIQPIEEKEVAVHAETDGAPPRGVGVGSETDLPQKIEV